MRGAMLAWENTHIKHMLPAIADYPKVLCRAHREALLKERAEFDGTSVVQRLASHRAWVWHTSCRYRAGRSIQPSAALR